MITVNKIKEMRQGQFEERISIQQIGYRSDGSREFMGTLNLSNSEGMEAYRQLHALYFKTV